MLALEIKQVKILEDKKQEIETMENIIEVTDAYIHYETQSDIELEHILDNVVGQENVKQYLLECIGDVINGDSLKKEDRYPIKGMMIASNDPLGKSFILDEIANNALINTLTFNGRGEDIISDLEETFQEAHKLGNCIIIIDGVDKFQSWSEEFCPCLKHLMNDIDQDNENILVIASIKNEDVTNDFKLYDYMYFSYIIHLDDTLENKLNVFKAKVDEANLTLSDDFNDERFKDLIHLLELDYDDCDGFVDIYKLKYGNKPITNLLMEKVSYERLYDAKIPLVKLDINVCVHEVGHAFMAYKNNVHVSGMYGSIARGSCIRSYNEDDRNTLSFLLTDLMINLSSNIAQELVFGKKQAYDGNINDIMNARLVADEIISKRGYGKYSNTVFDRSSDNQRSNSEYKLKYLDKKVDRLINKYTFKTRRIIKKNINTIKAVAKILQNRVILTGAEFITICKELENVKDQNRIDEIINKYSNL